MRSVVSILLLLAAMACYGQTGQQRQLEAINIRMESLEKENRRLCNEIRSRDSIEYCSIRLEIFDAYTNLPELWFDFYATSEKIAVTGLFARLMQANNPSSDILGFRFNDIVFNACETHFAKEIGKDKDRVRLSQVIGKILNNPLVSGLTASNPVTFVVSGIISAIAGFTTSDAELKKEGNRIKGIEISNDDAIDQDAISAFKEEMQAYINFYDALIIVSETYLQGLDAMKSEYEQLVGSVGNFQGRLCMAATGQEDNILITLSTMLPDPKNQHVNFRNYLNNDEIRITLMILRDYPALKQSVGNFKAKYNTLLFNFLSGYITALESARSFPDGAVDLSKIDILQKDIRDFITVYLTRE